MRFLVIGDIAWDLLLKPQRDLVWGSDVPGTIDLLPGGAAANVAVWARRLGVDVGLVGKIGDDVLGDLMRRHLEKEDVGGHLIQMVGRPTTRVGIVINAEGERSFVMDHSTIVGFHADDLASSLLERADLVFLNGYAIFTSGSGAFLLSLLAHARRHAIPIAFDPSSFTLTTAYGGHRLLADVSPLDIVLTNEQELQALAVDGEEAALFGDARLVVVKRGAHGARAAARDDSWSAPAVPVDVIDTTGAGDAFDAAFLVEYMKSHSVEAALRAGNRLGGYVASRLGAQPEMPA